MLRRSCYVLIGERMTGDKLGRNNEGGKGGGGVADGDVV
jgi:hypothetical protein